MPKSRLILFSTCLGALFAFANCSAPGSSTGEGGASGSSGPGSAGTTGSGGDAAGTTGNGGSSSGAAGNQGSGGSVSSRGGTTGNGGSSSGAAGNQGSGGNTSGAAGNGSGGSSGGGTTGRGGTTGTGGSTGGSTSRGGAGGTSAGGTTGTGGTGIPMDQNGVPLAKAGDMNTTSKGYLNLGDMRLINNRWGSDARSCSGTMQKVVVTTDKLFGWDFNRPTCGGMHADPDFPEVEFGVAPFGTTSPNLTTPAFSSTKLLPIQLSSLSSASLTFNNFAPTITTNASTSYWDHNFEFWISRQDPTTHTDAGVYAEIIIFLGWEPNRQNGSAGGWSCSVPTAVTVGNFNLCHQSDTWGTAPQWRFFNFVDTSNSSGALSSYNQKVDVKALLNGITAKYTGFTQDMWLTRIEVGTEDDDNTAGNVRMNNLTFEINGTSKSAQFQ